MLGNGGGCLGRSAGKDYRRDSGCAHHSFVDAAVPETIVGIAAHPVRPMATERVGLPARDEGASGQARGRVGLSPLGLSSSLRVTICVMEIVDRLDVVR
jgi:hypothetical protein